MNTATMKKVYMDAQKNCGLNVGDFVKILRKAEGNECGWPNVWASSADNYIGKIGQVINAPTPDEDIAVCFSDDWFCFPYFVLEKVSYEEIHNNSGLKEGDKVKITRKAESNECGWKNTWTKNMDNLVGKIWTITEDCGESGFEIDGRFDFPAFVLEKVDEETLEKPKFKVGDKVRVARASDKAPWIPAMAEDIGKVATISAIIDGCYELPECDYCVFPEDSLELVEEKPERPFKPFDKVLVRDLNEQEWKPALFSHYEDDSSCPFRVITVGPAYWSQCTAYEGHEHLCGTTNPVEE